MLGIKLHSVLLFAALKGFAFAFRDEAQEINPKLLQVKNKRLLQQLVINVFNCNDDDDNDDNGWDDNVNDDDLDDNVNDDDLDDNINDDDVDDNVNDDDLDDNINDDDVDDNFYSSSDSVDELELPKWPSDFFYAYWSDVPGADWDCKRVGFNNKFSDNHFCEKKMDSSHGLEWSENGPIDGKRCTKIYEPYTSVYHNTYLCVDQSSLLHLSWSHNGKIADKVCMQWYENESAWKDNYLCADAEGPLPEWPSDFFYSFWYKYDAPGTDWLCENVGLSNTIFYDNHFCEKKVGSSHGLEWSENGPIDGKRCTRIHEPSTPEFDNAYLCIDQYSPLYFSWSHNGKIAGDVCVEWYEEESGWDDNYLCLNVDH